jgi:DNA polymerase-3 subunit epsilon
VIRRIRFIQSAIWEAVVGAGFAVVDLETTGLFPEKHDRIVEIGIVHVSPSGEVTGQWSTVVNPRRDMGPQTIHGITAAMASRAPDFSALAPHVLELLDDRVPVAHNASFDARFLGHELTGAGFSPIDQSRWLCTMQLAKFALPPGLRTLRDCCSAVGIDEWDTHHALADATVTAQLLGYYLQAMTDRAWWEAWLNSPAPGGWPPAGSIEWVTRERASVPPPSLLERVSVKVEDDGSLNVDYLAFLDRVLLDRAISFTEADALVTLAGELGLGSSAIARTHRAYFDGLVSAAWADGELTETEESDIRLIGAALSIASADIDAAIAEASVSAPQLSTGFRLRPGDTIVITGETRRSRSDWFALLASYGFVPKDSMVKSARLLCASDPDSMSGKAKRARDWGIPIVDEAGLERLISAQ